MFVTRPDESCRNADKLATPDRNVVRKKTYNTDNTGVSNPELEQSKAISTTSKIPTASSATSKLQPPEEVDSATLAAAAKEDEGNLTDEGEGARLAFLHYRYVI